MTDPITLPAVAAPAVTSALGKISASLSKNLGKMARPIIDRAVVDLQLGFNSYLDASYNKCRHFKTILNQAQPLEVTKYYIHNYLSCGGNKILDDEVINNLNHLKFVVVTGLAGSGKSMFMKYLTVSKFENSSGPIPLFIELETRKNRVISAWLDYVEVSGRTNGIVPTDFHDAWR